MLITSMIVLSEVNEVESTVMKVDCIDAASSKS